MPLTSDQQAASPRDRVMRVYRVQSLVALALLIFLTALRPREPLQILERLGPSGWLLVLTLTAFAIALTFLRFPISREISVNPSVAAFISVIPLFGLVGSCWFAVVVSMVVRIVSLAGYGPTRIESPDHALERLRLFSLLSTYGIPMAAATLFYELSGGGFPLNDSSIVSGLRIAASGIVLVTVNILTMQPVQIALGYTRPTRWALARADSAVYLVALPYSVLVAYCWVELQFRGLLPALFTGMVIMLIVRNLAAARTANRNMVQRLTSLANIAAAFSVDCRRDELFERLQVECSRVMDTSAFSIALVDADGNLRVDFEVRDGERLAASPVGADDVRRRVLSSRLPLIIRSARYHPHLNDLGTESWLIMPMIVRDRLIGVLTVESRRRNAFAEDDLALLAVVASQAAAAVEDSTLYRELESLNVELEDRVRERTRELHDTNLRLIAADRAKTQFLANMSHELRTPLNSIIGFSNVLLEKTRDLIAPRLHSFLANIQTSGTHLLNLINDILDLSKIEAGKLELRLSLFDLRETIAAVERVIRGVAADSEITILSSVDPRIGQVEMDESRIKQILLNLLSNAVKFSPRGSFVRLDVEYQETNDLRQVRMIVADQGIGIPPDELPKVFDEFYQVGDGRTEVRGTGLGLPLAKRFAEIHGGTIEVSSSVGQGSRFVVTLPIRPTADPAGLLVSTKHRQPPI